MRTGRPAQTCQGSDPKQGTERRADQGKHQEQTQSKEQKAERRTQTSERADLGMHRIHQGVGGERQMDREHTRMTDMTTGASEKEEHV